MVSNFFSRASIGLALLLTVATTGAKAQNYQFGTSSVSFFSSAPLEDIEAVNKDSRAVIDMGAKAFLIKIPIKSFQFKSGLMQEHFNENYLESDKYPECVFRGTFTGNVDLAKDGDYPVTANGDLQLHGVTRKRSVPATISVRGGVASLTSKFPIKVSDHKINIPKVVFKKIAETVSVTVNATLAPL